MPLFGCCTYNFQEILNFVQSFMALDFQLHFSNEIKNKGKVISLDFDFRQMQGVSRFSKTSTSALSAHATSYSVVREGAFPGAKAYRP
jgi:hypothetical protein